MEKKNKRLLILTLFTSLFSVIVGGVSTFAWFQIDQKPIQSEIITGSPNITISDNIYGYKINQTIGNNGYLSSSNDILKFGKDNNVTGTNHHQDTSDTNFNVPKDGIGYYLVKRNPSGSFKYNYTADGINYKSYSWKFTEYQCSGAGTYMSRAFIDNFDVEEGDVFRVMHYSFANSKTIHDQLLIKSVYPTDILKIDPKTRDVTYADSDEETHIEGTYKIWLDYTNLDLSFESTTISSGGVAVRSEAADEEIGGNSSDIKRGSGLKSTSVSGVSQICEHIVDEAGASSMNNDFWLHIYNVTFDDTCSFSSLADAESAGALPSSTSNGTSKITKVSGKEAANVDGFFELFLYSGGGSNRSYKFWLPWWITGCKFKVVRGSDWNQTECTVSTRQYERRYFKQGDQWYIDDYVDTASQTYSPTGYTITYDYTNGGSGTSSAVFKEYQKTTEPSTPTYSGYTFDKWTTTNSKSAARYTFGSALTADLTLYAQWLNNYTVTLYASYFIDGSQSSFTEYLTSSTVVEGNTYTASGYTDNRDYNDEDNGIHYTFSRQNSSTWYKSEACDSVENNTWTNNSKITKNTDIYAKYNCDFTGNYTTFYIDINDANTDRANKSNQWSSASIMYNNGSGVVINAVQVASKLFRVTLPNDYTFRIGNGYTEVDGRGNNFSTVVENSGGKDNRPVSHVGEIIYIKSTGYGENHDFFWCIQKSESSYGTATIYTSPTDSSNPSDWTPEVTMDIGDGLNNYFIYEKGLQIPTNTYIHVLVDGRDDLFPESDYGKKDLLYNPEEPYLDNETGTYVKTCNYTGNARFTFYLTCGRYNEGNPQLVVAMVPDYGNGFYIMNYNEDYGTDNYIGSIKMTSNSDSRASYDYFYATAGEEIFIRSYINGVDRLIDTSWTLPRSGVYLGTDGTNDTAPGVIHFTNKGYYNITIENGVIEVTALDELSSSFKLNKLDTSNVDSAYKIWKQKTSLVLEVPFTAVNDYESQISLSVSNPLSEFVGVSLCVVPGFSSSKSYAIGNFTVYNGQLYRFTSTHSAGSWNISHVTEVSPYNFMRGEGTYTRSTYYNSLSNSSTITDQMNSRIKSQNNTDYSYAYILVDYLPTQVNEAGYAYSGKALEGNSAYSGSVCASGIYSDEKFTSSTLLTSTISYYLVATQV